MDDETLPFQVHGPLEVTLTGQQQADLRQLKLAQDQATAQFNVYVKAILAGQPLQGRQQDAVHVNLDTGVISLTPPV